MKILILALSGIGDALMFTPALYKLRQAMPNSTIDVLVMYKGVKDIYEKLPQIDKVHFYDFLNAKKIQALFYTFSLRSKYDVTFSVYPSNRKEYNLISYIIGAKHRVAVEYLREDKINLGFLNNIRITEKDSLHNVEENIAMIDKFLDQTLASHPPLQFELGYDDLEYAKDYLREKKIESEDLVIGFHPGCNTLKNHDKRRWEAHKFAELGERLIKDLNAKILLFGGREELEIIESIQNNLKSPRVYAVQTFSLSNTAAVMKRCNLFVTNDSSLMHVASALQLKVVAIIGPTSANYIHPWKTDYEIASLNLECAPCFVYSPKPLTCSRTDTKFKCIKDLSVNLVYDKVKILLNR